MKRREFLQKNVQYWLGGLLFVILPSIFLSKGFYDDELLDGLIKKGEPIKYMTFNIRKPINYNRHNTFVHIERCLFNMYDQAPGFLSVIPGYTTQGNIENNVFIWKK